MDFKINHRFYVLIHDGKAYYQNLDLSNVSMINKNEI